MEKFAHKPCSPPQCDPRAGLFVGWCVKGTRGVADPFQLLGCPLSLAASDGTLSLQQAERHFFAIAYGGQNAQIYCRGDQPRPKKMKKIDLLTLSPISRSLECVNALLDHTGLDVETFYTTGMDTELLSSFTYNIEEVKGFRRIPTKDIMFRAWLYSISIIGKAFGERRSNLDAFPIPIKAMYRVNLRGVFTLDRHNLPIAYEGYANCTFSKVEWCDSDVFEWLVHEEPIPAGSYFQSNYPWADKADWDLFNDVAGLRENESL